MRKSKADQDKITDDFNQCVKPNERIPFQIIRAVGILPFLALFCVTRLHYLQDGAHKIDHQY